MQDIIANVLGAAHLDERGDWATFLDGLSCSLSITIDGRTDTESEPFKRGQELGEALMALVPPQDL